jgi:hypothetical protein
LVGPRALGATAGVQYVCAVAFLQELPNDVKVAVVALLLIAFVAAVLYLKLRSYR